MYFVFFVSPSVAFVIAATTADAEPCVALEIDSGLDDSDADVHFFLFKVTVVQS
jgi:hypothetical protein